MFAFGNSSSLLLHFLRPVWFDSDPRGSLHGSPEHRPAVAAERSLARRQQHSKPGQHRTGSAAEYFFPRMHFSNTKSRVLLLLARRNSLAHGRPGRSGGGGQMSAEKRSHRGRQSSGEAALLLSAAAHKFNLSRLLFRLFNEGSLLCLVCRRTRLPSTSPRVWAKRRLCSCCCSTWLIPTLPPPTATPPCTSLPGRGRWRRRRFSWRPELHTHLPRRWVVCGLVTACTHSKLPQAENINSNSSLGGAGGNENAYADE